MRASTSPKGRPSARSTSAASAWPRIASRRSQSPEFDARTYGFGKLSELVAALPLFEMEERRQGDGPSKALYIRNATNRAPRRGGGAGR